MSDFNFGNEMTKTSTALALTTKGRRVSPMGDDPEGNDPKAQLAQAKADMRAAWDDFKSHAVSAVDSGCALGEAATRAKAAIPRGEFGAWVQKNFPFSEVWVRACMRAAETRQIAGRKREFAPLLKDANTVEKLAALKRTVQGKDPIEAPKRSAPKLQRASEDVQDVTEVRSVSESKLSKREKVVASREAELLERARELKERIDACDIREKALAAREKECDRREKALALAAAPIDTAPGPLDAVRSTLAKSEKGRAAKRAKAAAPVQVTPIKVKKGSRKAGGLAQETISDEGKGVVAGTAENGSYASADGENEVL
jgi:hypothetical protein